MPAMHPKHKIAISTISMGWHDTHTLDDKLDAAASHGYNGIELFWTDLEKDARSRNTTVEENARRVKVQCDERNLGICALSSFDNYEGSPSVPLAVRLAKASRWVAVARILGTAIVQIPANDDLASLAASADTCIDELRMLADIGAATTTTSGSSSSGTDRPITWAYEPMAWSARDDTWQAALHTVRRVARPNFKLCLDTYHVLAKLWADCTRADGRVPGGREALEASLAALPRAVRPEEVGFVQLSDAERMRPPVTLDELRAEGKHYSHYWCMWGRLFPLEEEHGAYLPMREACDALLRNLGWSGWVSMEVFHRTMRERDPKPDDWARRGMASWGKVQECAQMQSKL